MNQVLRRLSVLAYCTIIFILSSMAVPEQIPTFTGMDLGVHFFEYGILAFLFYWMLSHEPSSFLKSHRVGLSWIFTVVYGFSDEIHQYFVPTRVANFLDMMADALGATVILALMILKS